MSEANSVRSGQTAPLRKVRPELVRSFLGKLSEYDGKLQALEHALHRPDLAHALLEDALAAQASDVHLEPESRGTRIRFRIDGRVADAAFLSQHEAKFLVNQFKAMANLDPIARFTPKDSHARLSHGADMIDLRLALAPCHSGEALSIRILDPGRLERSMADLGLSEAHQAQLERWLEDVNGMFLAAGPTGSGKTTSIYALLHRLKFADRTVVALEDPVEYEIPGITQVPMDEKHHLNLAEGVKAMLRLDPDFLMIGEIRDGSSAKAAVDAAITGRVLLSTVHSRDAVGAISVLRNWNLQDHEIAASLSVVVAQRLVRKLCRSCRKPADPTESDLLWLERHDLPIPLQTWTANGCNQCHQLGYSGRTGLFELWRLEESDYKAILDHADEHALRRHLARRHHANFLRDGLQKVAAGVTSLAELRRTGSGIGFYRSSSAPASLPQPDRRSEERLRSESSSAAPRLHSTP